MGDEHALIGRPLRRREDPALLTGRGRYAGDLAPPGLVHLAVVRSPEPHGVLRGIDTTAARAMPGVLAVLTADDLPELADPPLELRAGGPTHRGRPVLARDRVRYTGEPVAVVAAQDPYQAADAADAVVLDIEPLPGAGDVLAATAPGAPLLHDGVDGNVAGVTTRAFGDAAAAFAQAEVVVEARLRLARVAGGYLEPRAVTAVWDGDERLTLWSSTQSVYGVRERVAAVLRLEPTSVRVLAEDVGGAFGAKGMPYAEDVLAPLVARRLRRPARWVATRSEDTAATAHSHGGVLDLALAATAGGELRGLRVRLLHDIGAYAGPGAEQGDNVLSHLVCAYRLPALEAEIRQVYTNAVPSGFIRGGGREVGNFAIERMIDLLAHRLGLDPVEVRRRNLIPPEAMPHDTGYPRGDATVVYDGGDYPRLLDTALAAIDHEDVRQRQAAGATIGLGVACCVESTGIGVPETARIRVTRVGAVTALVGSTPQGQGHRTSLAQVVAERLAWPLDQVTVVAGDTAAVPRSFNSAASRTAYEVGNAAALAATAARARLRELAAERLEADPADVEVDQEGARVRGAPARTLPLAELLPADALEVAQTFHSRRSHAGGCHAALVEVDPATGGVTILRYVIAHDSGRSINPLLVDGQLHGGYAHGLGYALLEEAVYGAGGAFRSASFLDYAIASAPEIAVVPELHEVHSEVFGNPEGFKGVGESGTIPVPAAIAAAVDDALRRHGIDAFAAELPLTPQRVRALAER
ncbi:MAG TPA: xanthine dehydrogenase family protein molybdopterin-binding subunit [Candidatus Dormibacteraeota bacterium]|nr:xanthine dehydrogenase family protein molybdopterin-binding subunit [Candidatus Dormibacteraeota bacterium]